MDIDTAREFLLWCLAINYGLLLLWMLAFVLGHDWMFRLHGRWFRLSREQFDLVHYAGMAALKLGVLLFNLAPWLALLIVARGGD